MLARFGLSAATAGQRRAASTAWLRGTPVARPTPSILASLNVTESRAFHSTPLAAAKQKFKANHKRAASLIETLNRERQSQLDVVKQFPNFQPGDAIQITVSGVS